MSYSLSVREHVMLAHSLSGAVFGPAQRLHGATYVVTATFRSAQLDADNLVIDIGLAHRELRATLEPLSYQNLDELALFDGQNTTTEFLCAWVHRELAARLGDTAVEELAIELRESHIAWAEYSAPIR